MYRTSQQDKQQQLEREAAALTIYDVPVGLQDAWKVAKRTHKPIVALEGVDLLKAAEDLVSARDDLEDRRAAVLRGEDITRGNYLRAIRIGTPMDVRATRALVDHSEVIAFANHTALLNAARWEYNRPVREAERESKRLFDEAARTCAICGELGQQRTLPRSVFRRLPGIVGADPACDACERVAELMLTERADTKARRAAITRWLADNPHAHPTTGGN